MSPELIKAVKERIVLGRSKESIVDELHQAGHNDEMVEQAFKRAELDISSPTNSSDTAHQAPPTDLPSASSLIQNGWEFVKIRTDFVLSIMLPLLTLSVIDYLTKNTALGGYEVFSITASLLSFVAMVIYLLSTNALLYVVSDKSERQIVYKEALTWSKSNFFGLLWISILTSLVVIGGFWLFIVPGIMVSLYLYFAQYVYVSEGLHGFDALLRSRALVQGNWWLLATRIGTVGLIFLAVLLAVGIVVGLLTTFTGSGSANDFVFELGAQVLSALMIMVFVHAGAALYRSLSTTNPTPISVNPDPNKWKYVTLAILAPVLTILFITWVVKNADSFNQYNDGILQSETIEVKQQLSAVYEQAKVFYKENNSSYVGVCEVIQPALSAGMVECNDDEKSFATSVTRLNDEWCVDSTGYKKTIKVPLGERTSCLGLDQ